MQRTMERVREARKVADMLWLEYQALIPMAASPRLDGMPRSGGAGDHLAPLVDLREEALLRWQGAKMAFEEAEREARAVMDGLPPRLYSLCLYYYIGAMTKEQTMETMHVSESSFKRYKAEIAKMTLA